jgi:AraC family transcriptional regulator, arabinose operon regulatory protein
MNQGNKNNKLIKEGNNLIQYETGSYGFLNLDKLKPSPLTLLDFGIERRHDEIYDFDNSSRTMEGYLFQYTLKGYGIYETDGTEYTLTEGKGFFTAFPEKSRYYLPAGHTDNTWEYIYIHFGGETAKPFFRKIQKSFGSVIEIPADSIPVRLFLKLHEKVRNGQNLKRYEGGEIVYRFLSSLLRELETPAIHVRPAHVGKAVSRIEKDYRTISGIEELAEEAGISLPHFTRLFKKETGMAPIHYLTNVRLQSAIFLLLNSSDSVEQIARQCGFSCGNYFCKVFRKSTGISPLEYRKRN